MDVAVDGFAYTVNVRQEFPESTDPERSVQKPPKSRRARPSSTATPRAARSSDFVADTVSFHEHTEGGRPPVRVALLVLLGPPRAVGFEPGELEARGVVGHQRALFDQRHDD